MTSSKLNTIAQWVQNTYAGEYFAISEAAKQVDRSTRTLKRWKADGRVEAPSHFVVLGKKDAKVNLYSHGDMQELQAYSEKVRPGRPRAA
jgi:hypothetical protein